MVNVLNKLSVTAVTELAPPAPGPLQVAIDFNEALQPAIAQNVALYKIAQEGASSLPIQSAVYSDNGSQHRVVLTVAAGTAVIPGFYHVSIDAANLSATNGDSGEPKADQLWVDVTSENTLKPIAVQSDGSFAVSGNGQFLGYGAPQQVLAGNFAGNGRTDLVVLTNGQMAQYLNGNDVNLYDPLLLLKSNGDGTYAPPVPIALGGQVKIESIASVDWNHDGFPDLVVGTANPPFDEYGDPSSYSYYVLLNDGHGNFTNAPETPIPVANANSNYNISPFTSTGIYDLSGNGQYDIVHLGALVGGVDTGDGNGTGDFDLEVLGKDKIVGYTPQMELPMGLNAGEYVEPSQIAFADLNGDGKPDIITMNGGYYADQPGVSVLLSTPTGYATGTQIINPLNGPIAMGIGAFTSPSQKDIAIVYDNYNNSAGVQEGDVIQMLQNDGKGNFTAQSPISLNRRDVASAVFGDVNKDGIPDLVMVLTSSTGQYGSNPYVFDHVSQLSVWTWTSDGHGGFTPTTPAPIPLNTTDESAPTSISLADLDGDGYPDLVLGSNQLGEVRLAINDGTGTMRPPMQPLPFLGSPNAVEATNDGNDRGVSYKVFADFNNSGHLGFVTVGPGGLDVYVGRSGGGFMHTASLASPLGNVTWVKVGDLNNDGIPDIVFGNSGSMGIYLGNGDGTFRQAPTFVIQPPGAFVGINNVSLADVNHDGNLDAIALLTQENSAGYIFVTSAAVFFGDGQGDLTFNQNTVVPYNTADPTGTPTLADFTGDGSLDLLVPTQNSSDGTYSLTDYLGNGNGTFTPGPIIYSGKSGYDTQDLVGDLNGDGKLYLVAVNGITASVYLGDGKGGFQLDSTVDLSMGQNPFGNPILPSNIALGDFNGDGKLDLAVAYYDYYSPQNVVVIYPGDGTGHFGSPQTVTVGANPFTLVSIPRAPFLDVGTFAVTDHGPTANNATPTVVAGLSVSIPVLDNASNPDKVPLTISQVSAPAHGTAHVFADSSDPAGAVIIYTANPGFSGSDSFTYTIQDPAGVQSTATASVTVLAAPVLQFSSATYSVGVSSSNAVITVTRTSTASIPVTVQYATSDGTAFAGYDYTAVSGTLTFNANDTSKTFDIPLLNNGQSDSNLTVNIGLSDPTGGAILGTQNTAVLTITNPLSPPPPPPLPPPPLSPPSPPPSSPPAPIFNAPPFQPPALHTPPLLAFFDAILGGIETVIPYESETVTDRFLGFPLFASIYDSSGNLESVTLFGITVTFLFA